MKTSKLPSPARSQGANLTPKRHLTRSTRSVGSPARSNVSGRLTSIIEDNQDSFAYSPLINRKSVLNDNTNIEEPRRASWWKKLNENSRDVIEVMNAHEELDANNVIEEYVDILSQEKQLHHTLDLPDSSDNESINSIVIPQRKLFNQKDVQQQKNFNEICGNRETLAKLNKTNNELNDKTVKVTTKNLFGHHTKRSRPVFPEALLNISLNKTAGNQTMAATEVKSQVKSLFGNRPGVKRKNMFIDFIVSESEDEIPEIEPKIFAFPKKPKSFRRPSSSSRASSIATDVEMDDWNMLPSSTMVDHQLENNDEEINLHYEEDADENDEPTLIEKQNKEVPSNIQKAKSEAKQNENSVHVFEDIVNRSTRSMNKSNKEHKFNQSIEPKEKNNSKSNLEVISDEKYDEIHEENATEKSKTQQVDSHVQKQTARNSQSSRQDNLEHVENVQIPLDNVQDITNSKEINKRKSRIEENQIEISKCKHVLQENDQSFKHKSMAYDKQKVVEETQEDIDESNTVTEGINIETKQINDKSRIQENIPIISVQNKSNVPAENELEGNNPSEDKQGRDSSHLQDAEMKEVNSSHTEMDNNESEHNNQSEVEQNDSEQEEENDSLQEKLNYSEQEDDNSSENESVQEEDNESVQEENEEENDSMQVENEEENDSMQVENEENISIQEENAEDIESENDSVIEEDITSEKEASNESTEVECSEQDSSLAVAEQSDDEGVAESDQEMINQTNEQTETNDEDEQIQSDHIEEEENDLESDTEQNESITNLTHDTTGKNRNNSPEAVLQHDVDPGETFMNQRRNTSVRKTKSIIKNLNIKPSLAPVRESIDFSDGTRNSSAEGSGWDSHRTTRKTIRQTLGKDLSPRKSLRALVMEKSAKRFTTASVLNEDMTKFPQANSTELPDDGYEVTDQNIDSDVPVHEVSKRTRQATLEKYLQSIKRKNIQNRLQMEEEVINSIKNVEEAPSYVKKPLKPGFVLHKAKSQKKPSKTKVVKSTIIPLEDLPENLLQDMKYKPPKRYKPGNAAWITKRLYNFLENKLASKYDFKARLRAERLVENIYNFTKDTRRLPVASQHAIDVLKKEMATLHVVQTHFDFYNFFHEYMPREIRVKVVPDVVNKLPLPKNGVFTDI